MICQLCPNLKIIRKKQGGSTSNMLRHVKRFHAKRLSEEKSTQPLRGRQNDSKMIMEGKESADVLDVEEDEVIKFWSATSCILAIPQ